MRASLHELWGCGHGPISRLAPQTRILAGAGLFGACVIAPVPSRFGLCYLPMVVVVWLLGCRTPWRIVRTTIALGSVLLAPYFLLVPFIEGTESAQGWSTRLTIPLGVFARGLASLLVSIGTVSALSISDLREGILRLPVPRLVSAILLQVVYQSAVLAYETRQIAAAMSVRGASGTGIVAWRVLASLPQVWLPRILIRAERVAAAMDVRGYCEQDLPSLAPSEMQKKDVLALGFAVSMLSVSAAMRLGAFQ